MSGAGIEKNRKDFPILGRKINANPLVYLDNAATTQKPLFVLSAIDDYYRKNNANVHRGMHTLSSEATGALESAREKVAKFIGAKSPREIIFTKNTTESINLLSRTLPLISKKGKILLTEMEHHSNLVPWQNVGRDLDFLRVDAKSGGLESGRETLKNKMGGASIVSVTHASNVLGTINPLEKLARFAHEEGAYFVVDGAQSVPHMKVRVGKIGCDFLAFSGHKMCGPTGIGVLWGKEELLDKLPPFLFGGEMISEVTLRKATWNSLPWKFEAGTPPIAEAIGLGAACDYLKKIGMGRIRKHEIRLTRLALSLLSEQKGVRAFGPPDAKKRGGVVSFAIDGVHPHDISSILDAKGIEIRSGNHCAEPLMRKLKVPGTARASFYLYNTREEVEFFSESLADVKKTFRRGE